MTNVTAEIRASDPAQAEVNFEGDVFTTAQGIKYKLLVGKDKVELGEVVS
jgi:predicted phage tail protein